MSRGTAQEKPYVHPLLSRAREDTSLLGFVNVLLRHRRIIVATALLGTAVCLVSALMEPRYYSTHVLFTARGAQSSPLGGLAAQFGLTIVGDDPTQSMEFYEDLLKSTELLRRVTAHDYRVRTPKGVVTGKLPVFLKVHAGSPEAEIDVAAVKLRTLITTVVTRRTGIITFAISAPYPDLAQQIAVNMMDELDKYNAARHHKQVSAERTFIEQRMDESQAALSTAENDLKVFRDLNREYRASPTLHLENDRLERAVDMRQQLYTALAQAYDRARIEEEREGPTINIVEPADLPEFPDVSYGARNILLGTIAGMLVGIVVAFVRERIRETETEGSPTFVAYKDLKRATVEDIARPWRRFRAQSSS
jgi:uncharacterized protein involved in exopolysaccharide biosynthesis